MSNPLMLLSAIASAGLGLFLGYLLRKQLASRKAKSAEKKADEILSKARDQEKELLIKAKEKSIHIIDEAKKEEKQRRSELKYQQKRLERREETFDKKLLEIENSKKHLEEKAGEIKRIKEEIQKIKDEQIKKLEKIAGLSLEDAKKVLMENTELRIKDELSARMRKLESWSTEEVEKQAKKMITTAMQRIASSHSQETTITSVAIPSEEMKGRIIGKEGRNIKTLEQLTGTEIVIDETPDSILISGFNPIRRQVTKIALDKLILDGRIHPGRIEEAVEQSKQALALEIKKAGEEAVYNVGVVGLDPKLLQILGRLKYRTSYGQNVLQHSMEVALISKLLAEELGADVALATKGGLLHDIGKAVDHEIQGAHPEIGQEIMKKFGLPEELCYMAVAHHEDEPKSLEGIINKVADAISGSRPGARKESFENYVQRIEELEEVAKSFKGVEKSYAIYAGREIRVFAKPEAIDDLAAIKLARDIAAEIENKLKYPGEIKVNVIRETRVAEYAR